MRKHCATKILSNEKIAENIYSMTVFFPEDMSDVRAGQFAGIYLENPKHLLQRPISICDFDAAAATMRFVYQIQGDGTKILSELKSGEPLRMIAPLGNGYNITTNRKKIALVGGGVGVPPMLALWKAVKAKNPGAEVTVILGFRSEPILYDDFKALGADPEITTDDGSHGFKGNCVDFIRQKGYDFDIVYSCGPKIMLKFLSIYCEEKDIACFVSMEERMGCGLGVCVGCAIPVKSRVNPGEVYYKRVCKDGPVFNAREVVW